jgi:hypothetical protein
VNSSIRARRSGRDPVKIVCGRSSCGAQLGKTAGGYQTFAVPPAFARHRDAVGVFYELPEQRARRERQGLQPVHRLVDPIREYQNLGGGHWRVVRDDTVTSGRMAMWQGVELPVRVRCPNCKWIQLVDHEVLRTPPNQPH